MSEEKHRKGYKVSTAEKLTGKEMTSAIILTGQGIGGIRNRQKRLDLDRNLIGSGGGLGLDPHRKWHKNNPKECRNRTGKTLGLGIINFI